MSLNRSTSPLYVHIMTNKRTLGRARRALAPKTTRPKAHLKVERGVRVYQGDRTRISISGLIDREREKRSRELIG